METSTTVALCPSDDKMRAHGIDPKVLREPRFQHVPPKCLGRVKWLWLA